MKNKNLIYVAGPTGIGKTKLAIDLAKKFNTEIVSCDSRQFYKELKIGTCPPSFNDLNDIKHHFIHNKSIKDTYSVGDYEKEAIELISEIFKIKDTLILVGGSGLYAYSILFGMDEFPNISKEIKEKSKISQNEWVEFTKHIWNIPIPNKSDVAYGSHTAIMPEEIVYRCVKLFSFVDDVVLDPFAGSGTTLKVAHELGRKYIGYEIMEEYKDVIDQKLSIANQTKLDFDDS